MKNNIKAIREKLGLSQAGLASHLGMTAGNVSHIETGKQSLMPDAAAKIISLCREAGQNIDFNDLYCSKRTN